MANVGVAVSGGGHRAALYGLGVLLYLADTGENANVATISSVSGGSITNAFVGLSGDYRRQSGDDFRQVAQGLANQIANRGTLFAWVGTKIYLAGLVAVFLATFMVWLLPLNWFWRLLLWLVTLALWEVTFLRRRGEICGRAYAATIFKQPGGPPKLSKIEQPDIDHVLCATHLHAGEHIYFSGRFIYSYRFGWGSPGDIPLHIAVQASTALPGAFPPRWVRTERIGFSGGAASVPRSLALADGGVYDNMADQWLSGLKDRQRADTRVQIPDTFVLANASASLGMQPIGRLRLPAIGEIASLKRNISIMYDNSASLRKRDLIDRFDAADRTREGEFGYRGALLDIRSDPFRAAEFYRDQDANWPDRAARARAILEKRPQEWESDAHWAAGIGTSLSKLGVETSARLLRHAYTLAGMNLHLFLDMPLVDIPPLQEFRDLCA